MAWLPVLAAAAVVVYSVTTRTACIPTTKTGNPFQRAVC
jgi:hypothetical protein